jgi:hypothetical protein
MRVTVHLQREHGQFRPKYAAKSTAGDLYLTYRAAGNRRVPVLQLLGAQQRFPSLYDAKLVELSGTNLRFVGYEACETAWVLQEWICEITA